MARRAPETIDAHQRAGRENIQALFVQTRFITMTGWRAMFAAMLLVFAQFAMAAQACGTAHPTCDVAVMSDAPCAVQSDQAVSAPDQYLSAVVALAPAAAHFPFAAARAPLWLQWEVRVPAGPDLQVLYCSYQA